MLTQLFTKTLDALSDWTGCVATRVSPHPQNGTATYRLVRALRQSGLFVRERHDLTFDDLRAATNAGCPVIVAIHNPGAADSHWVVVYGHGRQPK